ncbi:MAG: hypothetical protein JXR84_29000 [Anaerolineae bacterium]|nr:hypothetical protein [Anaerolineae bacterium]
MVKLYTNGHGVRARPATWLSLALALAVCGTILLWVLNYGSVSSMAAENDVVREADSLMSVRSASSISVTGPCFAGAYPYLVPPDGHLNVFAPGYLASGIYQGLMELPLFYYRWADGEYVPILGDNYEIVSPDRLVVHLRTGVKWSDGSDFGTHDVVSHFRLRRLLSASVWVYLSDVVATDSQTVEFIMAEPAATVIRAVLREYISPASVYGGLAEQAQALFDAGKTPADQEWIDLLAELQAFRPVERVVTGPYNIALEDVGENFLTMHKVVTSAWASLVKFDCVRLYNGETPVIEPLVLAQEIDYATHGFSPATEQAFRDAGIRILRPPVFSGAALLVNMAIHPFELAEVRQALAYAIDMNQTAAASLGHSAKRQNSMTGVSDNIIGAWLTSTQLDEMEHYAYAPTQAAALLSSLSFTRSVTNGIWLTDLGQPMVYTLTYPAEYGDWAGAAHDVAQQLATFGISVTLQGVFYADHPVQVDTGQFQMAIRGWGMANPHPYESFRTAFFTHNSAAMSDGDPGLPGISYALQRVVTDSVQIDIEQMILDCPKGLDLESQKQRVYDLAWVFNYELPKIPLWERYGNNPIGVGERVVGWPPDDDPIYKNSPYNDSFVIMMLLDGTLYPSLAQTYLEPGQQATLVYTSPTGSTTAVQIPSGAITETVELVYAQVEAPSPALPDMTFAGMTFELTAYRDSVLLAGDAISGPITVTVTYTDADIAGIDESTLLLYRYVCSGPETSLLCVWEEIGTRLGEGQTLDTENNVLTAWLTGLSRFGSMGVSLAEPRFSVFLPLVLRN